MKLSQFFFCVSSILILTFDSSDCKSRQKRWWFWYNGYADTILGFILAIPFQTFLPGLGPEERSLKAISDSEVLSDFEIQPQYEEEIKKALTIFSYLGISTITCQERLICLLSSKPEAFSPISELVLREIGEEYGPIKKSENSLIWRYHKALRTGLVSTFEQCEESFLKCPVTSQKILNTPLLKAWQFLASKISMRLL